MRVGVGRGDLSRNLSNHVLGRFDPDEEMVIEGAIARAADAVEMWATEGLVAMMNRFNRETEPGDTREQ